MATTLHKDITHINNHVIQSMVVDTLTARDALTVGIADVGRVCYVTENKKFYILTSASPVLWMSIIDTVSSGGGGGGSSAAAEPDSASYTYDEFDRVLTQTEVFGASTTVRTFSYNAEENINTITVQVDGVTTRQETYTYNAAGNVVSMNAVTY